MLDFFKINAFTTHSFAGNPASVVFLSLPFENPSLYTQLATEMATPETVFILSENHESLQTATNFSLRFFMPTHEVKMCGHATLAAAYALFYEAKNKHTNITFHTLNGEIEVSHIAENKIALDFPADNFVDFSPSTALLEKLTIPNYIVAKYSEARNLAIIEVENLSILQHLKPNFGLLKQHNELLIKKVAVTTNNFEGTTYTNLPIQDLTKYDFISRCFCPWIGIDEDALSAASHTLLTKFWATYFPQQLHFRAFQASKRTGELEIFINAHDRMTLMGSAVVSLKGKVVV
jgi:PhzF family phenazine biosynthesis protein